jgi:hypothetical protein
MVNYYQAEGMGLLWKYSPMMSTIMDISKTTYFQEQVFISGTVNNIFLVSFNLVRKCGEDWREKFDIKEISKRVGDMERELVGTQLGKFTQEAGKMERDMDKEQ